MVRRTAGARGAAARAGLGARARGPSCVSRRARGAAGALSCRRARALTPLPRAAPQGAVQLTCVARGAATKLPQRGLRAAACGRERCEPACAARTRRRLGTPRLAAARRRADGCTQPRGAAGERVGRAGRAARPGPSPLWSCLVLPGREHSRMRPIASFEPRTRASLVRPPLPCYSPARAVWLHPAPWGTARWSVSLRARAARTRRVAELSACRTFASRRDACALYYNCTSSALRVLSSRSLPLPLGLATGLLLFHVPHAQPRANGAAAGLSQAMAGVARIPATVELTVPSRALRRAVPPRSETLQVRALRGTDAHLARAAWPHHRPLRWAVLRRRHHQRASYVR